MGRSDIGESTNQQKPKNAITKVGLYHYRIAAYAIYRHVSKFLNIRRSANKDVLLFFSAHIGDAVMFLDALESYKEFFSRENGYNLVFACRPEVWKFLEALDLTGGMQHFDATRDYMIRSYSSFKSAVKDSGRTHYSAYVNPRIVSIIEHVFAYCIRSDVYYTVALEGDQSKSSKREGFFKKGVQYEKTTVKTEDMQLQRFRILANQVTRQNKPTVIPRIEGVESSLEVPNEYVVVAPSTAETPSKCWPISRFAKLIDEIIETFDLDVCLSGGKADRYCVDELYSLVSHPERLNDYVGHTGLKEWIYLISKSKLVICNDSSPMHIAASTGRPCVCIGGQWEGSCYYPYIVDTVREDDRLPNVILSERMPCYYCSMSKHGRKSNPLCNAAIEAAEPYPCIESVTYESVRDAVYKQLLGENLTA